MKSFKRSLKHALILLPLSFLSLNPIYADIQCPSQVKCVVIAHGYTVCEPVPFSFTGNWSINYESKAIPAGSHSYPLTEEMGDENLWGYCSYFSGKIVLRSSSHLLGKIRADTPDSQWQIKDGFWAYCGSATNTKPIDPLMCSFSITQ